MNLIHYKYIIKSFFLSFFLFIITSPLLLIGVDEAIIVGTVTYQGLTVFLLSKWENKCKPLYLLLAILLGSSCIELPLRVMYFDATLVSLSTFIGHETAIIIGFVTWKIMLKYNYRRC